MIDLFVGRRNDFIHAHDKDNMILIKLYNDEYELGLKHPILNKWLNGKSFFNVWIDQGMKTEL